MKILMKNLLGMHVSFPIKTFQLTDVGVVILIRKKTFRWIKNTKGQMFIMAVILMAVGTVSIMNSVIEIKNNLNSPSYNALGDVRANILSEIQNGMELILAQFTTNSSYTEADAFTDLLSLLTNMEQYALQKGFSLSLEVEKVTFVIEMSGKSEITIPDNTTNANQDHYSVITFQIKISSAGTAREGFFYEETIAYYYSANLTIVPTNNTLHLFQQRWHPSFNNDSKITHFSLPVTNALITFSNASINSISATEILPAGTYTFPSNVNLPNGNIVVTLPNGIRIIT